MSEKVVKRSEIYVVKTTMGQEMNVARMMESRVSARKIPIKAILVPEGVRGYIFVESPARHYVYESVEGIKHVKSILDGVIKPSEVEKYIVPKRIVDEISVGDTVEIVAGPFRGMQAKVVRVDKVKEEVVVELLEATYTLPVTVRAPYLKKVKTG